MKPDACGAFQNADETRFSGTRFSEDDCHAGSKIDLCPCFDRVDPGSDLDGIQADWVEGILIKLLFFDLRSSFKWIVGELLFREQHLQVAVNVEIGGQDPVLENVGNNRPGP